MAKTYTKTQVEATEAMLLISKADRILANDTQTAAKAGREAHQILPAQLKRMLYGGEKKTPKYVYFAKDGERGADVRHILVTSLPGRLQRELAWIGYTDPEIALDFKPDFNTGISKLSRQVQRKWSLEAIILAPYDVTTKSLYPPDTWDILAPGFLTPFFRGSR